MDDPVPQPVMIVKLPTGQWGAIDGEGAHELTKNDIDRIHAAMIEWLDRRWREAIDR